MYPKAVACLLPEAITRTEVLAVFGLFLAVLAAIIAIILLVFRRR